MFYALFFVASFLASVIVFVLGWRNRPTNRPAKVSALGWATLALGATATLTALPMVTAALSIVLTGAGLITGTIALIRRDTNVLTIVGQCLVALPSLFWIFFLVGELTFPH